MKALFLKMALIALIIPNICLSQSYSIRQGHIAFGDGLYSEAETYYQAAIDSGSTWDWLPDLRTTAGERSLLGNISPADTHYIGVIFVSELRITTDTGLTVLPDVTPDQKYEWEINFKLLKKVLETFSAGNWTIEYDTVSTISNYDHQAILKPDNPDHLNLEDYWYSTAGLKDSYITLSNTRSPAMGLARTYPYVNSEIYSPDRGMAAINSGTHGFSILLHEFFHIVEWVSNAIEVTHGYYPANQSYFPDWTPGTEFDYYKWHFSNTLNTIGWNRLNHRTRWIPFHPSTAAQDSMQTIYNSIPLNNRLEADTLAMLAGPLESSFPDSAAGYWEQALVLSPFHYTSLYELVDYYRYSNPNPQKASEITGKLKLIRQCIDYYTIDTINLDYGEVIGFWHREDILKTWQHVEWDITPNITEPGCHEFRFYYTEGWNALMIDSVQLLENGIPIAIDIHSGFTGNSMTDIDYYLEIQSYNPGATYSLKARVKGSGGTDSYGQIHHKTGTSCISGTNEMAPEKSVTIFPNPTSGVIHVEGEGVKNVQVFNLQGKVIHSGIDSIIDLSNHPSGIYIILVLTDEETIVEKLVLR